MGKEGRGGKESGGMGRKRKTRRSEDGGNWERKAYLGDPRLHRSNSVVLDNVDFLQAALLQCRLYQYGAVAKS